MKYSFLILALSVFTHAIHAEEPNEYVRAGQIKMSAKDCAELGVKVSIVAFSPDTGNNYSLVNLKKNNSFNYFDTTRKQIRETLSTYCKDDKSLKTIDDFQNQLHSSCASTCDANLGKFYKDSILGSSKEKENASLTCLSICNQSYDKLEFLKTGARFSEKQIKPEASAAGDCSGAVTDTTRRLFKNIERDFELKGVTHKATINTIGK